MEGKMEPVKAESGLTKTQEEDLDFKEDIWKDWRQKRKLDWKYLKKFYKDTEKRW